MPRVSRSFALTTLLLATLIGLAAGTAGFTFVYAKGASYLTDDPRACANCHVMQEQYSGWVKASHHNVAVCNDCHTPPGLVPKYLNKALNGWSHSVAFTTGDFHEPIHIKQRNREVTERACRGCHGDITATIEAGRTVQAAADAKGDSRQVMGVVHGNLHVPPGDGQLSCIRCHRNVGHPESD
jgi:cytochrome c nitrite reductase small subunit